jgi:IPT/TIG domain-containing protein
LKVLVSFALALFASAPALAQDFVINGSFESPPVAAGTIQHYTSIPGWAADSGTLLHLRNECCGAAHAGSQWVEFDSPVGQMGAITEDVATSLGHSFQISVAYAPRPGTADNRIEVLWGGAWIGALDRDGTNDTQPMWTISTFVVEATQSTTRLRFEDPSGGSGGLLDAVSVVPRLGMQVYSVLPSIGSSAGGDLVHLSGFGFTTLADTTVTFGGAPATVLSVASDRIDVQTPPGTGAADVSVVIPTATTTRLTSYLYVAPDMAARFGNVNVGRGDRENVLFVNQSSGDFFGETTVGVGQPLSIYMQTPSSRATARFAFYAWVGTPLPSTNRLQPAGLGTAVFPTPLNVMDSPQPRIVGNNFDPRLGTSNLPTTRAPSFVLTRPHGVPAPVVVTMQGIIQDDASLIRQRVSLTNAVVLHVQ